MSRLPQVTGRETVKALTRAGWIVLRQRGSHVHLGKEGAPYVVTVPIHDEDLRPGTLRAILRQAGLSVEEFVKLL